MNIRATLPPEPVQIIADAEKSAWVLVKPAHQRHPLIPAPADVELDVLAAGMGALHFSVLRSWQGYRPRFQEQNI